MLMSSRVCVVLQKAEMCVLSSGSSQFIAFPCRVCELSEIVQNRSYVALKPLPTKEIL